MTIETDKIEADINRSRHALNDTIEALGDRLTPGQIVDEAMGLLQGQAGKFTTNLGRQVRDNPLPVLLIAAGAALLFTGKGKSDSHSTSGGKYLSPEEDDADTRYKSLEAARSGAKQRGDEDEATWSQRVHELEATALGLKQHADEAIDAFKQRVKSAGASLEHTASGIRHKIASGYARAANAVVDGAGAVGAFTADQAHQAKQAAGDAKQKAQDLYDQNPLVAGAIGFAVGALIGAAAPLSSLERDKLNGLADTAAREGADLAHQGVRAVETLVDKAASAIH